MTAYISSSYHTTTHHVFYIKLLFFDDDIENHKTQDRVAYHYGKTAESINVMDHPLDLTR